jgi:hypothetical protein
MTKMLRTRLGLAIAFTAGMVACASSPKVSADGCPPDRDVLAFSLTSDGTTYEELSEAVGIVARTTDTRI